MNAQLKSYRTFAVQSLVVAIITFLLLEGVGLFVYFLKDGSIYYTEDRGSGATESPAGGAERSLETRSILHPYLGFVFRPSLPLSRVADSERIPELLDGKATESSWTSLSTNNHGFFSASDYPYVRKNQRELIIGVFGGSVAQWFALQGAEQLKNKLQQHPFFSDRDLTVVNYSQGGFKQPQQLQTLSYFMAVGQKFDIVVNIDGFNEVALSHINHQRDIDTSMPSAQHLLPLLGLMGGGEVEMEMIDNLHNLRMTELKLKRFERWESSTRSAGLHLVMSVLHARARSEYAENLRAIDSMGRSFKRTNLVFLANLPKAFSMPESIGEAMNFWLGAAVTMQELCNARDILYLEVIQPNQYFSRKEFSEQEREIAINHESPYREAIESGYQELPDLVRRMREEGVNVLSAVSVFDEIREQTYSDSCCHYNQTGNELLADKVAESIIALVAERRILSTGYQGAR
jgi:hypothetical protein